MSSRSEAMQLSGYLYKKSTGGEWQRRYFETNGNYLTYYKTHKMSKLLAAVSLPQVGVIKLVGEVSDGKGSGYVFQLDLKDRQYLLRAQSLEEAQRWVDYLIILRDGQSFGTTIQNNPMNSRMSTSQHHSPPAGNIYIEPKATIQKSTRFMLCSCVW